MPLWWATVDLAMLVGIDGDALDAAVGAWLAGLSPAAAPPTVEPPTPRGPWPAVAVDGRTLRGSSIHTDAQVHLLAAMRHDTSAVLGQLAVAGKSNEITAFAPLLADLELARTVVTADAHALHGQREHAQFLVTVKHAAYVLLIKPNQPHLYRQLGPCPGVRYRSATAPAAGTTAPTRSAACRC
ncbi:ISAs1 family transposase [Natronosporangium hydrolyticum]|uniref:ISAs1 family transposase n=1 Tax=Natronosporangium hydrolyticum TaxID=2811111 RepID=A0A895YEU2_9ACTN|nr:ISAs1 family transposase [Natronosporangium hydrolyticum]QSB14662.1 ISAs1 family transposase [Natronosporangium hydrolyticum]